VLLTTSFVIKLAGACTFGQVPLCTRRTRSYIGRINIEDSVRCILILVPQWLSLTGSGLRLDLCCQRTLLMIVGSTLYGCAAKIWINTSVLKRIQSAQLNSTMRVCSHYLLVLIVIDGITILILKERCPCSKLPSPYRIQRGHMTKYLMVHIGGTNIILR
jgi:hypothetical protein